MSWLAVLAAVVAGGALGVCSIQAVIRLSQGRQRLAGGVGRLVLVPAIGITNSIAGAGDPAGPARQRLAGFLLGVLCGMLVLAYRGYAGSQRQHASLRQVLGFSRLLELIRSSDAPLDSALNQARDILNASRITLRLTDGEARALSVDGEGRVSVPPDLEPDDPLAARVLGSRSGRAVQRAEGRGGAGRPRRAGDHRGAAALRSERARVPRVLRPAELDVPVHVGGRAGRGQPGDPAHGGRSRIRTWWLGCGMRPTTTG
jgi:hypothetical protein